MKKIILIIVITVFIVIIGAYFAINKVQNKYNYEIEKISQYDYFLYKENELYGVIDREANVIIDAKYSNIVIPNPRKRYIYLL